VISQTHGFKWMAPKGDEVALISEALRNAVQCENFLWSEQTDDDMPPLVPIDDEYHDMPPLVHIDYSN